MLPQIMLATIAVVATMLHRGLALSARTQSFTKAITRSGRRGEWRRAILLLDQLERTSALPVASLRPYGAALVACDRAGCEEGLGSAPRWAEAREIFDRDGWTPDAFSVCVGLRIFGRSGKADEALALYRASVDAMGHDEAVADAAATALARCGKWSDARKLFDAAPPPAAVSFRQRTKWLRRSKQRLEGVARRATTSPESEADVEATARLEKALGDAATNGSMPSFADEGARRGYARIHFVSRTSKVANALFCAEDAWVRTVVRRILGLRETCNVVSLGGGPGYDFAAVATLSDYLGGATFDEDVETPARHRRPSAAVRCAVLDYESGWASSVEALADAYAGSRHAVSFGACDITAPLAAAVNAAADDAVEAADVIVCSYCVAENKKALRAGDWAFFRDVFKRAKPGALFLLAETTHRLWPELVDVACDALPGGAIPISIPTDLPGRSGSTLFLHKGPIPGAPDARAPNDRESKLLAHFETSNQSHERRLAKPSGPGGGRSAARLAPRAARSLSSS